MAPCSQCSPGEAAGKIVCRTPLDVMRLDMESGGHRYAVCVASYGYMGDLMRLSERLRFLGPARYGIAGAITLLRGRAYNAEVCITGHILLSCCISVLCLSYCC